MTGPEVEPATADAATDADLHQAWKALPRQDRTELASACTRGLRGVNRYDAALMLWWSRRQVRQGPWAVLRFALFVVAVVLVVHVVTSGGVRSLSTVLETNPILPVLPLIPLASWVFRRPKLQQAITLNAAVLAGRQFDGPPDPEEAERLLALARKEGWFRGTRPQR